MTRSRRSVGLIPTAAAAPTADNCGRDPGGRKGERRPPPTGPPAVRRRQQPRRWQQPRSVGVFVEKALPATMTKTTTSTDETKTRASGERVTSFWPLSSAWQSLTQSVSREVYLTFRGEMERASGDYITNSEAIFRDRIELRRDPNRMLRMRGISGWAVPTSDLGVLEARSLSFIDRTRTRARTHALLQPASC